jgi:hypothetical protein
MKHAILTRYKGRDKRECNKYKELYRSLVTKRKEKNKSLLHFFPVNRNESPKSSTIF